MTNINSLPSEILIQIFKFYLETETQYTFIHSISKVCRRWQKLSEDSSYWQKIDGTLSFEDLKDYCSRGILKDSKSLVFSQMQNSPSAKEMQEVYRNLPLLNSINFSNVMGMRNKYFVSELLQNCPYLQEIIFNDKLWKYKISLGIIGFPMYRCSLFKDFLNVRGTGLVSLVFSSLYSTATEEFFWIIGYSCPNLEVLKVENVALDNTLLFPTVHMQLHLQKLRELCLGYPVMISNQEHIIGFKNLEIFRNPSQFNYLFPKCSIDSVIFESKKLKELDIRRCLFAKRNCLHSLNFSYVENLNISLGKVYDLACFIEVIQNWSQSLKVLNISKVYDISLNTMFKTVILGTGLPNLIHLNLSTTSVTLSVVKLIVQNCPRLRVLNLEYCINIRELSFKYEGEAAIKKLLSRLIICSP